MRSASPLALAGLAIVISGCAPHVSRSELAADIVAGTAPPIVDVRSRGEYEEGHVPGAVHIPFYSVIARRDDLPRRAGEPLVVYCEHGPRAGLARVGLWLAGAGEVRFLDGHMTRWRSDGYQVESEPASE
jgi:rhodanese-related sulfurtransferase